jgi:hypothetical protein
MLTRLPTAVESIGKKRSVTGRGLGLRLAFADRFFTAIIENPLEKGQTAVQPDPDVSLPGDPRSCDTPSQAFRIKPLSRAVNET